MRRLTITALLIFAVAAAARDDGKAVVPNKEWVAVVNDNKLEKQAPKGGLITDAKAFEKLWKAWRKDEKLPKVDFAKQFAVVTLAGGPNKPSISAKLKDGDLKITSIQTLIGGDGFGYSIATFDRKGVEKVNGKALPKPKAKPGEPDK
jgi:hypothetical protein